MGMPRTCVTCQKIDNPLNRLRFKKSKVDGKIYCENCSPVTHSLDVPEPRVIPSAPRPSELKTSAGLVVVDCPDCAGGQHRPNRKPCTGCSGYGAVRIQASLLNVYRPPSIKAPTVLTED